MLIPISTYKYIFFIFSHILEVKLSQDHQITVEAAQNKPLGQELEHIDQSILGKGVKVEKSNKKLK